MMFQQPEPPNRVNTFMDKFGLPIITLTIGTVLAAIIIAIWVGNIRVVDFNWLMLFLGCLMFVTLIYLAWYSGRTRKILRNKYHDDLAALKKEYRASQDNFRDMINNEFNRLNEWASNYSQKNAKEQAEHLETVRNEFQQAITQAKDELTRLISIQNTNFSNWVDGHADRHGEVKRKLTELEQKMNAKKEL